MKVLVFGQSGQVATELCRRAGAHGATVVALDRAQCDLANPKSCAQIVQSTDADAIINAAAFTAVDKAEEEKDLAQLINCVAPGEMARAAANRELPFLHISTDYVFDGSGQTPKSTDAPTGPLGVYGQSKLDGEREVLAAGGWQAVLRTSWVFSSHGGNFVKTILRLAEERDQLTIVADQIGGPTPAATIADALLTMTKMSASSEGGLFHFSGAPDVSWAGFAREIVALAGLAVEIKEISTRDYPTPAVRPLNSRLECARIKRVFGIDQPDWRAGLSDVLADLASVDK